MAGIGFELQKLVDEKSIFKRFFAYVLSALISSGPWLFSMFSLLLINLLSDRFFPGDLFLPFRVTVVYAYALSIMASGSVQFLLTRYLADQHYLKKWENFFPGLFTAFGLQFLVCLGLLPLFFHLFRGADLLFTVGAFLLFVVISSIWLLIDFLSASKSYGRIIASFLIGSAASFALTLAAPLVLPQTYGPLYGFLGGQILLLVLLLFYAGTQFPLSFRISKGFLGYFRRYSSFLWIGLFYNGGIWIDKVLNWILLGKPAVYGLSTYDTYDATVFFCYLTMIPALAVFLLRSETSFFTLYRRYYDSFDDGTYGEIRNNGGALMKNLAQGLVQLGLVQILTSGAFAGYLFWHSQLTPLFLFLLGGASFQALLLFMMIYLMYFDLRREVTLVTGLFFFGNGVGALLGAAGLWPLGAGYLAAGALAFLAGLAILKVRTTDLTDKIVRGQVHF